MKAAGIADWVILPPAGNGLSAQIPIYLARSGPDQLSAETPDQPAQDDRQARNPDEAAEAADAFDRRLLEFAQRVVELQQRPLFRRGKLLEEQCRDALPGPLYDDRADGFRAHIQTGPGERQIERAQLGPALADQRQGLQPHRRPADHRLLLPLLCRAGGDQGATLICHAHPMMCDFLPKCTMSFIHRRCRGTDRYRRCALIPTLCQNHHATWFVRPGIS